MENMEESTFASPVSTSGFEDEVSWSPTAVGVTVIDPTLFEIWFWIGVLISFVGIFGNGLILRSVWVSPKLRTSFNVFVVSLALVDLTAIFGGSFFQLAAIWDRSWRFGMDVCLLQNIVAVYCSLTSVAHVIVTSIYRGIATIYPHQFKRASSKKTVLIALGLCHGFCFLFVLIQKLRTRDVFFDFRLAACAVRSTVAASSAAALSFTLAAACVVFVTYSKMRATLGKVAAKTQNLSNKKKQLKIVVCMAYVLSAISLGYVPLFASMTIAEVTGVELPQVVSVIGMGFAWMSSAVNWIIYGAVHEDFRKAYKRILCKRARIQTVRVWTSSV